ncbi:M23 family metallopeptidase [Georgenia daeguensis]|uniref:M23ase beta-sheet core domain-containing protein n=1 Tax=Georgenia daeguensis TaxID=908355 RepID=A0ABP8EP02_9MICO
MPDSASTSTPRSRGAHRAEPTSHFRSRLAVKACALGVLGALTVAVPVFASNSDDANAAGEAAPKATSSTLETLDAGFAAAAKEAPTSDALVEDPADQDRAAAERASRVQVREPLPSEAEKAEAAAKAAAEIAAATPPPPPAPEVVMPVAAGDYRLTSKYGPRWGGEHLGVDFAAPLDTPIHAVADGEVTYVGNGKDGRSSSMITIKHEVDGKIFESWYVHMYPDDLYVTAGQKVKAGDVIAGVGNNGNSTGPHLHFEIHTDASGTTTEPLSWMKALDAVDVGEL